jgi:two-component system, chemotaxis family, protein-glutamate methylesterase/glutaminase
LPKQDIVVIGASAGGVEALQVLTAGLPADLAAAVFVVLHIGSGLNGSSYMPEILTKAGPLAAAHPKGAEKLKHGRIYVARPDCHLILEDGRVRSVYGPKENRTRPAINPLFRSAAAVYGPRVTGVILTGLQDDGVAGLAEIKRRGGVAVVQEPTTALFPGMPQNAIKHVETDYIVPLREIAAVISNLAVTDRIATLRQEPMEKTLLEIKCPECTGPLWEEKQGSIVEYRCRIGHAYSPLTLREEQQEAIEKSLWSSVITLENGAAVSERLVAELGQDSAEDARVKREQAKALRDVIAKLKSEDQ